MVKQAVDIPKFNYFLTIRTVQDGSMAVRSRSDLIGSSMSPIDRGKNCILLVDESFYKAPPQCENFDIWQERQRMQYNNELECKNSSDDYKVVIIHFDSKVHDEFKKKLKEKAPEYKDLIEFIFCKKFSYGTGFNKAFLIGTVLNLKEIFFFDDDTYPVSFMDTRYFDYCKELIQKKIIDALHGGYIGYRSYDLSLFSESKEKFDFLDRVLDKYAPYDIWSFDNILRSTDRLLGGNCVYSQNAFEKYPAPPVYRTMMSDDSFMGKLLSKKGLKIKSFSWPVIHAHKPGRYGDGGRAYLESFLRTPALFYFLEKYLEKKDASAINTEQAITINTKQAITQVKKLIKEIESIGNVRINAIIKDITKNIKKEIKIDDLQKDFLAYIRLLEAWSEIIKAVKEHRSDFWEIIKRKTYGYQ